MNKVISLTIFIVSILYLVYNIDFNEFFLSFRNYSYLSILFIVLITAFSFYIIAFRWQILTSSNLSFYNSYKTNLISMAINQVAPARAGDIYKPLYIRKNYNISIYHSISSLLIERSLELVILFFLLCIVFFKVTFSSNIIVIVIVLIILGIFFIVYQFPHFVLKRLRHIPNKRIRNTILKIVVHFYKLDKKSLLKAFVVTLVLYMFYILSLHLFISFFTTFSLTFFQSMVLFVVSAIGVSLPSSPAGIGIYEATVVFVLNYFGIESSEALSFAIVYHMFQVFTILGIWLYFVKDDYLAKN